MSPKIHFIVSLLFVFSFNQLTESYKNIFNRTLFDNLEAIFKIISNWPESTSFKEAIQENKLIGTEQALIGPLRKDLDEARTCGQLIKSRGFDYEIYNVTTIDGYILTGYHIINPKIDRNAKRPRPFLLLQGIVLSCSYWLQTEPGIKESLAYFLAARGEDVWLINYRGQTYSRRHVYLDAYKDPEFFDYTFYDTGIKDIPATVEYIKKRTGYDKIRFIGHSMGTIEMLVHLSVTPSASDNYSLIFLASPIGYLGQIPSLAGVIPRNPLFLSLLGSLRTPFPPVLPVLSAILTELCTFPLLEPVCFEIIGSIFGSDTDQKVISRLSVFVSQLDTISTKNLAHILQAFNYDHIRYYDYGPSTNLKLYKTIEPPIFPYENINPERIVLLSANNDPLAPPHNVQKLRKSFKSRPLVDHVSSYPDWSHLDYGLGKQGDKYFHEVVYNITQTYDPSYI